ncbi:MAG TPA: M23 family metallopeptidase, partial [Rickettsiales bacterium]|nr:M23 family metallopeptidase [Rickettsiales bacterium]
IVVGNSIVARYKVKIDYDDEAKSFDNMNRNVVLSEFEIIISPELQYVVSRLENGEYKAKEVRQILVKKISKYFGVIKNGLFLDATNAGASPNAVMNMIDLYAYDIDFARDIREGNEFEILVESYFTEGGRKVRDGNILFSMMKMSNRVFETYAHRVNGNLEYFDVEGNSTKKSLLRTPINGARVSSRFGMRRHPVLGYSKMHKGVDFAAPTGTPILAAGNGVIIYRDRHGSYGNFIRIRHSTNYETAYAHASRFSNRFKNGSTVKQGDVIAYVGTTGRSTGPHLHFEVKQNGRVVNPSKVKSVSGIKLRGAELDKFKVSKIEIDEYRKNIVKAK